MILKRRERCPMCDKPIIEDNYIRVLKLEKQNAIFREALEKIRDSIKISGGTVTISSISPQYVAQQALEMEKE